MAKDRVEGLAAWSESVMVLAFDPDVRHGVSFRLSRYPEHDASWVWLHAISEGRFHAYSDNRLPATTGRNLPQAASAEYRVPGLDAWFARTGPSGALEELRFSACLGAHESVTAPEGEGPVPVAMEGTFRPGPLKAVGMTGRFEWAGEIDATLAVGGRAHRLRGPAKAHEQTQEAPRFAVPFTYAMLWGPSASMIGLATGRGSSGELETAEGEAALERFAVAPRGPQRRFELTLPGGKVLEGGSRTAFSYEVPIFGRAWRGGVVSAEVGGHAMVGMINDWRSEDRVYELAN